MSRDLHADAEDAKARGNECLKNQDFDTAVKWYSQALDLAKKEGEGNNRHVYLSNRSAAYLSKGYAESALKDAEASIHEKPDWPKGYGRKGAALHAQKKYADAIKAYEAGLVVAPGDASLEKGLAEVRADSVAPSFAGARSAGGAESQTDQISMLFQDPNMIDMLKSHPKTSEMMKDAAFEKTLQDLQSNPSMLQLLLQTDKRFMTVLSVLLGVELKDPEERRAEMERKEKEDAEREKQRAEQEAAAKRARESPEEREERERKERAKEYKEAGNALYKAKQFEEALQKYDLALSEDATDMTFHLNKASVLMEMKDLDKCLAECDKAIEVGRANHAKYPQIAKAYERRGNAFVKFEKLTEAITEYQKAQLEHRTAEVDERIKKIERTMKLRADKAYVNPELGKESHSRGMEKLASGEFPAAVSEFNEALKRDPSNAQYFADRGMAYMKLMDFGRAQEDIDKAVKLDPTLVTAYARKGKIETFTKKYHRALESYRKGLELDPNDSDCKDGLRLVEDAIHNQSRSSTSQQSTGNSEEDDRVRHQRAMEDPEVRAIMQDPVMQQVLRDLSTDPSSARKHLSNPDVAAKIETLIAAGIVKTG